MKQTGIHIIRSWFRECEHRRVLFEEVESRNELERRGEPPEGAAGIASHFPPIVVEVRVANDHMGVSTSVNLQRPVESAVLDCDVGSIEDENGSIRHLEGSEEMTLHLCKRQCCGRCQEDDGKGGHSIGRSDRFVPGSVSDGHSFVAQDATEEFVEVFLHREEGLAVPRFLGLRDGAVGVALDWGEASPTREAAVADARFLRHVFGEVLHHAL